MPVRRITKHGERVLKTECPLFDFKTDAHLLPELLSDMWDTMYGARGVGLAAPQIGVTRRIAIVDVRPGGKSQKLVLINPEIISTEDEIREEEGCLSIPGIYAPLRRYRLVRVSACDEHGERRELFGEGLLARAFQHEIDHLDGKLYIDRLPFEERLKTLDAIKNEKLGWR